MQFRLPKLDWKYILMLVVAVAGVLVLPLWESYAEYQAHSLKLRRVSQTALKPAETHAMAGLTISVDGVELDAPYLSVVELVNDGSKAISATDFESPLEIRIGPNVFGMFGATFYKRGNNFTFDQISKIGPSIVRAVVSGTAPRDIEPSIVSDAQSVKLKPLLLNPKDTIAISIITSGGQPQFTPRARIAGISSVAVEDATKPTTLPLTPSLLMSYAFLLFLASQVTYEGAKGSGVLLNRRSAILVTAVTFLGAIYIASGTLERVTGGSMLTAVVIQIPLVALATLLSFVLNRKPTTPTPEANKLIDDQP